MKQGFWTGLTVGVLAAGMAGCVESGAGDGNAVPQAIDFGIATESRAAIEAAADMNTFGVWGWYTSSEGDAVDVFGEPTNGTQYEGVTVRNSGVWTYDGARYWVDGVAYDFYAAHPAEVAAACTREGRLEVAGFDASRTGENAVDLMTAVRTDVVHAAGSVNTVPLSFRHELARVRVVVRAEQGVKATVTDVSLYGVSTKGDFSRDLDAGTNGTWTNLDEPVAEGSTPYEFAENVEVDGDVSGENEGQLLDLLVIPQGNGMAQLRVIYQREGETVASMVVLPMNQNVTSWVGDQSYQYTLIISVDAITFSGFTVDEWGVSYSGGDINIGSGN